MRGNASFYKWRAKYGGMDASLISQMKAIEDENRHLKRMYADLSMQADLLKEALGKNAAAIRCLEGKRLHLPWIKAPRWPRTRRSPICWWADRCAPDLGARPVFPALRNLKGRPWNPSAFTASTAS
jgi:hypothetical protein